MAGSDSLTSAMRQMLAKFTTDFPTRRTYSKPITEPFTGRDVVLITGTTGSFGCHLLDALIAAHDVSRVYALNRRSTKPLRERQAAALQERGIDASILNSEKLILLESDITAENWALPQSVFHEMHLSVTHVIHNAWRVNVIAKLPTFESVLQGLRNFIDFCLTSSLPSPPRLLFTSSMGVIQGAPRDMAIPEAAVLPELAVSNGYSQSKWIAEQMLFAAAATTPLDPLVVRVGQLTGGKAGAWAPQEWFPVMVQSAPYVGCFADDPRDVLWVPFEIAAAALLDFRKASNETHVVHLVHPQPVIWHSLAAVISSELSVPLVPFAEWLAKLEHAARSGSTDNMPQQITRAAQLIPFLRSLLEAKLTTRLALSWPEVEEKRALEASSTLADPALRRLGADDVKRWIAYWERCGAMSRERPARL
ncbi:NAD(P)-binding protein [Laetiporus sulphureus 93-53]|uniref:NAD(P)-binding protein n=1 Tax=Laetiporus sulphureus 93-53 TaxID=1314785 RepID=A0A165BHV7_9APHY|nr:NAD(P)-binding protein [Laetiporus sulphureus 93-53]KZT01088.1 NAD(P)-binding protein [Laetiporus sulphureus 93-53]